MSCLALVVTDTLAGVLAVSLGLAALAIYLALRIIARRHYPQTMLDIMLTGDRLMPICGGLVAVRVPQPYQAVAQNNGLSLVPRNSRGIALHITASMIEHGVEEEPAKTFIESWAQANDARIIQRNGEFMAYSVKEVDNQGQEIALHLWMVARELTLITIAVEVNVRQARESAVKYVMRDVPRLIEGLRARVQQKTLANERGNEIVYADVGNDALSVHRTDARDLAFVEKWEEKAKSILAKYLSDSWLDRITPTTIDWCLLLWQRDNDQHKTPSADLALALGVAFGNHCARTLELRWGVTHVDGVRHLVLRHAPSKLVVFPFRVLEAEQPLDDCYSALFSVISSYIELKTTADVG
jgi:hypothetical protein